MNSLVIALIISVLFLVVKLIERQYSDEKVAVKKLVRDAIVVYLSSVFVLYGSSYYNVLYAKFKGTDISAGGTGDPVVFTDNPEF